MYLCRTLGELLRMHSGCFCYRSNNVWNVKNEKNALTTPPSLFCVWWSKLMKQRAPTACHSQKKDIGISNHPWVVCIYIYIYAQPPPKQKTQKTKKKNITMGIAGSPMGSVSLFLFFGFLQGALPKESPFFFWFKDVFKFSARFTVNSPKRIRILLCYVVFLFVWRCTYEYVQLAKKSEHQKWTCYIVNHSTNSMSGGRGWGDDHMCIYIYIITAYIYIYTHTVYVELIATTVWYLHSPTSKLVWKQLLSANCIYIYIYIHTLYIVYIYIYRITKMIST